MYYNHCQLTSSKLFTEHSKLPSLNH